MTIGQESAGLALRISVTDRCPLHCVYCRPVPVGDLCKSADLLQTADVVRFVRTAQATLPVGKVRLTGGEPLVRRDIVDIVAALAPLELPDLALTTNGQRLASQARRLRQAGLDRINISLDSLDAEIFRQLSQGGDLTRTIAGIEAARTAGLDPVRINTVVLRGINDHQAESLLTFALDRGCELRFIELMPSGLRAQDYAGWFLSSHELRVRLGSRFKLVPEDAVPGSSSRRFRVLGPAGQRGWVGFISPNSHPFCSGCRRLRLTADGRLMGCLGRPDHIRLTGLLRSAEEGAEARIAAALLVALGCKRQPGPFSPAVPMSAVGG
ncbi:MAG TPA: GTP 3',8-cyclase MoaA [Polyangia bacterium]